MPNVEVTKKINSTPEKIYDYLCEPSMINRWWTSFEEHKKLTPGPIDRGSIYLYRYNMMGVPIEGKYEILEVEPNMLIYLQAISGIECTFDIRLVAEQHHTEFIARVDYVLPQSLLHTGTNRHILEEQNERTLNAAIHRLQQLLE